ncbi:antibiotic biosynthesis monooxygenase [Sediminicoccus sp. KRV36]|uniref:putative quinol monooxygenase n=1 Tax=Sediminicoccus sp. KRV36 TaxID=3133721 RepID=UPI00200E8206|nr:antibiotic biosynthesis monooxygenase [Sediminicoccus rosea]UPY36847.1 antibiotic biosynthesis monooxygenase [Sediminicoccus rosea]
MGPNITVTLTGRVRPDRRKHLLSALPRFAAAARRHPGCLAFEYKVDKAEREALTLIERWVDPVAAMHHLATDRTRRFLALTHECLEAPPAMTTVAALD